LQDALPDITANFIDCAHFSPAVREAAARDLFKVMRAAHFIFHRRKKVSFKLSSGTLNTPMQIYSCRLFSCVVRATWIYGTCWRSPFRPPLLRRRNARGPFVGVGN
jgi:hypothetical protein